MQLRVKVLDKYLKWLFIKAIENLYFADLKNVLDPISSEATVSGVSRESLWKMTLSCQWLMCQLP